MNAHLNQAKEPTLAAKPTTDDLVHGECLQKMLSICLLLVGNQ